jgi:hypothetical protein
VEGHAWPSTRLHDLLSESEGRIGRLRIEVRIILHGHDVKIQEVEKNAFQTIIEAELVGLEKPRPPRAQDAPGGGSLARVLSQSATGSSSR